MELDGRAQTLYNLGRLDTYLNLGGGLDYLREICPRDELIDGFESLVADVDSFQTKSFADVFDFRAYRILIYTLVRALKPRVFVETGVLHGMTSAFILHALRRNGDGILHSIDLPSYADAGPANTDGIHATLPPGYEPGWMIPPSLRSHWRLTKGRSTDVLPGILQEYGKIDVFCHDSDHTYETMWRELTLAWDALAPGGVLICDNIDFNTSFFDFCRRVDRIPMLFGAPDSRPRELIRFAVVSR